MKKCPQSLRAACPAFLACAAFSRSEGGFIAPRFNKFEATCHHNLRVCSNPLCKECVLQNYKNYSIPKLMDVMHETSKMELSTTYHSVAK